MFCPVHGEVRLRAATLSAHLLCQRGIAVTGTGHLLFLINGSVSVRSLQVSCEILSSWPCGRVRGPAGAVRSPGAGSCHRPASRHTPDICQRAVPPPSPHIMHDRTHARTPPFFLSGCCISPRFDLEPFVFVTALLTYPAAGRMKGRLAKVHRPHMHSLRPHFAHSL